MAKTPPPFFKSAQSGTQAPESTQKPIFPKEGRVRVLEITLERFESY